MIVNVEELQDALILARKVCALVGKKALNEDNTFGKACRFYELGNIDDLINWAKNKQKKMYRLAAYLCEPMDVCKKGNLC